MQWLDIPIHLSSFVSQQALHKRFCTIEISLMQYSCIPDITTSRYNELNVWSLEFCLTNSLGLTNPRFNELSI